MCFGTIVREIVHFLGVLFGIGKSFLRDARKLCTLVQAFLRKLFEKSTTKTVDTQKPASKQASCTELKKSTFVVNSKTDSNLNQNA